MRVLHIDTGREMRGGQWQALHLMQGLVERGIESCLLAPKKSALLAAAASVGLNVRVLGPLNPVWSARQFDLVHAHDARAHTLGLLCSRPLIVSRRVAFPIHEGAASRMKYRRAHHFLAVSDYVKRVLIDAGIEAGKITVVYDGVRIPEYVKRERFRVLALDSADPRKGKQVIESASQLSGIPVHFSTQLLRDLPEAALFVYVTESEGLGSAALLAMAYGAPVLASDVGGLPEIVHDRSTGILTDNTPQAVASAMRRILDNRELASRLAATARNLVERKFTLAHMVENTVRAYEKVLA